MITLHDAAALDPAEVFRRLGSSARGLDIEEARARLKAFGPNTLGRRRISAAAVLWRQLRNPLLLLLIATAITSSFLGEHTDAYIIIAIVSLSVGLGFINEYRSERAMADLHNRVRHRALAIRGGRAAEVDVADLVPGDVVQLGVGDIVPADLRLIETTGFSCDESVLTGEALPAEKNARPWPGLAPLVSAPCLAFMGTTVASGTAVGVAICTGMATEFGAIAARLAQRPPETQFQSGLRHFSGLLVSVTAVLTISVFAVNTALHHPLFESLLFALAIAVGLTPQLLPAIVTVSLATGAERLAKRRVIVKRLVSIEDLGNVDVLFTDKTGTLTEDTMAFSAALDPLGNAAEEPLTLGLICNDAAATDGSVAGGTALDRALRTHQLQQNVQPPSFTELSKAPFDYDRKMMSVLVRRDSGPPLLITKGAPESVLSRCRDVKPDAKTVLQRLFASGARVMAVASRSGVQGPCIDARDEHDLELQGFLTFADPVKASAAESIRRLQRLGVDVRIITGDNEQVAAKVCRDLAIPVGRILNGAQIDVLSDADLKEALPQTTIFARVTPEQKSRIIRLQRARGNDVGFLGDGVNDAVALHNADVGISVDSGADVAKDAADIVLLDKDLAILADGVVEGRRIFSNTIKYILAGTSSNFGNMFSAAGASLFLPFLPMTAPQLLLNNLLYDASEMTIPTDNVDEELLHRPAHWDVSFIRRFMLFFGPVSSVFDYATFFVMLLYFHARAPLFRTGWFVESLATQALVIFVIRTRRIPFFRSTPSMPLAATTLLCVLVGAVLPFTPLGTLVGLQPLPAAFFAILAGMIAVYIVLVEGMKRLFFRARPAPPPAGEMKHRRRVRRIAARWT